MAGRLNTYLALLIITIAGASATWVIVRVAYADAYDTAFYGDEANYAQLKQSILTQ